MEKILTSLGLGPKEQKIYTLILERAKIAPATLSRLSGINRITVYSVLKELLGKGLVIEDLGGKTLYYSPAPAESIARIIEQEKKKLTEREGVYTQLQEFLKTLPGSKHFSIPKIRFVEGSDIEKYLYEATPRWNESSLQNNPTWWGYQDHDFVEKYRDWIVWFWDQAPEPINLKLFSNDSEIESQMAGEQIDRREIRFWDGDNDFTGSQWIVGAYIIMIVTSQKPAYLVEIHDSVMAHNMREVFKRMWER